MFVLLLFPVPGFCGRLAEQDILRQLSRDIVHSP